MVENVNIRRVFAGANTYKGFFSLFDFILPQDEAARIFILKGGPGTGKSTFMAKLADDLINLGMSIEYIHCSSDNNSLDGIVIPSIKVAVIDGTAPHIVDPKNPGAIDEIINLGEFWDESSLIYSKEEIMRNSRRNSKLFDITYSHLKEAKVAYDEWKGYIKDSIDKSRYNEILKALLENIFKDIPDNFISIPRERHLFASGITPGGIKNYIDTLVDTSMKSFALEGEPGTGIEEIIDRVAKTASEKGLYTEHFHCPFEPEFTDMVIIPEINTAVLNISKPFYYNVTQVKGLRIEDKINMNVCVQKEFLIDYEPELENAKKRFYSLIASAIEHLSKAKTIHDALEMHYIPSMNFNKIEEKRQEILEKIKRYII